MGFSEPFESRELDSAKGEQRKVRKRGGGKDNRRGFYYKNKKTNDERVVPGGYSGGTSQNGARSRSAEALGEEQKGDRGGGRQK